MLILNRVILSTSILAIMIAIPLFNVKSPVGEVFSKLDRLVEPAPTPETKPAFSSYRNISIGMSANDVRKTLGEPKSKSDEEDFYVYGENESLQFIYDAGHSVTAISITLFNDLSKAPTVKAVIGEEVRPNAEGAIFKTVRYPKAGFWVSYSKTAGDTPSISITLQKI